jgi:hypothetical protein
LRLSAPIECPFTFVGDQGGVIPHLDEAHSNQGLKIVGTRCRPETITSWVCPKQYLTLRIKAAFSRNITRVKVAGIVERAVPTASLPPFRPFDVIAILAVGISRFPGRTKHALGGVARTGDYVSSHRRGSCQHSNKNGGNANQSEFRHAFPPLWLPLIAKYARELPLVVLKDI